MIQRRDEFLSEEDLDLKTMTDEELDAVWTAWLEQAQITNEQDKFEYSHGVFLREPPWKKMPELDACRRAFPGRDGVPVLSNVEGSPSENGAQSVSRRTPSHILKFLYAREPLEGHESTNEKYGGQGV